MTFKIEESAQSEERSVEEKRVNVRKDMLGAKVENDSSRDEKAAVFGALGNLVKRYTDKNRQSIEANHSRFFQQQPSSEIGNQNTAKPEGLRRK